MSDAPANTNLFWGLAVSIGLNLLLAGIMFGMALRPGPSDPQDPGARGQPEQIVARTLLDGTPPSERRAVRRQLGVAWQDTAPLRRALDAARQDLSAALRAEPYDPDRTAEAFANWTQAEARLREDVQRSLAEQLESASPEVRERLARSLMRHEGRGRRGRLRRGQDRRTSPEDPSRR